MKLIVEPMLRAESFDEVKLRSMLELADAKVSLSLTEQGKELGVEDDLLDPVFNIVVKGTDEGNSFKVTGKLNRNSQLEMSLTIPVSLVGDLFQIVIEVKDEYRANDLSNMLRKYGYLVL